MDLSLSGIRLISDLLSFVIADSVWTVSTRHPRRELYEDHESCQLTGSEKRADSLYLREAGYSVLVLGFYF